MNTLNKIVEPHTPTPAVPEIPELVRVYFYHAGKRSASRALNESAKLAAIHALHLSAISAGSCNTVQRALCDSFVQIDLAMSEEYSKAMLHGGLLYAWHGTKAFEVQE